MTQFFRYAGTTSATSTDVHTIIAHLDRLIEQTDKAANLNKNEYNLSAGVCLAQCRSTIMNSVKASHINSTSLDTDQQNVDNMTPRFSK